MERNLEIEAGGSTPVPLKAAFVGPRVAVRGYPQLLRLWGGEIGAAPGEPGTVVLKAPGCIRAHRRGETMCRFQDCESLVITVLPYSTAPVETDGAVRWRYGDPFGGYDVLLVEHATYVRRAA